MNTWRWLTAGLATGFGILGKFTMLLIGPIFLWGLIKNDSKALRTPWPYVGGLVALLTIMPNLVWNHQNDWITWKFQMRHGFSLEKQHIIASNLPQPLGYDENSPEAELAKPFISPKKEEEKKPKRKKTQFEKSMQHFGDFLGAQLALWGTLLFSIGYWLFKKRKDKTLQKINPIFWAGAFVPIGIFALISLKGKVEGNWAAMYLFSAAPIIAAYISNIKKSILISGVINVLLLTIVVFHGATPILKTKANRDRILLETHGYENLAKIVSQKRKPIFADSYQIVSMLRFYQPSLSVKQWPGITRPSEYVRRVDYFEKNINVNFLQKQDGFWLVTTDFTPPRIKGFQAYSLKHLYDCVDKDSLVEVTADNISFEEKACKRIVHIWKLIEYRPTKND